MQSFDIVTRDGNHWVQSIMANSKEDALTQHFASNGDFNDGTVKAKGPKERARRSGERKKRDAEKPVETEERNLNPVRLQTGGKRKRATSIPVRGRMASKSRAKKAR